MLIKKWGKGAKGVRHYYVKSSMELNGSISLIKSESYSFGHPGDPSITLPKRLIPHPPLCRKGGQAFQSPQGTISPLTWTWGQVGGRNKTNKWKLLCWAHAQQKSRRPGVGRSTCATDAKTEQGNIPLQCGMRSGSQDGDHKGLSILGEGSDWVRETEPWMI